MTDEVELKLVVNQQFADFLAREISNFRVLKQETIFLGNCYYGLEPLGGCRPARYPPAGCDT